MKTSYRGLYLWPSPHPHGKFTYGTLLSIFHVFIAVSDEQYSPMCQASRNLNYNPVALTQS